MSILRKHSRANFTTIDNELLSDHRLSFRARGVATYLLSKPDDWRVNIKEIVQSGTEGREAIRAAMRELATLGYLMRDKENQADGSIRTVTVVADYPAFLFVGTPETRFIGYGDEDGDDRPTRKPSDGSPVDVVKTELLNNTTYCNGRERHNNTGVDSVPTQAELLPVVVVQKPKDNACVKAYREFTGRYPNKAQMAMIAERNPELESWNRAMRAWIGRGYNPSNIATILEWSFDPSLAERKFAGSTKRDPTDGATWAEMFAEQENRSG